MRAGDTAASTKPERDAGEGSATNARRAAWAACFPALADDMTTGVWYRSRDTAPPSAASRGKPPRTCGRAVSNEHTALKVYLRLYHLNCHINPQCHAHEGPVTSSRCTMNVARTTAIRLVASRLAL